MLLGGAMLLMTFGGVWNVAQHKLGQVVRGQVGLATLNEGQRRCIDLFPADAAMNHIDVLMALQLHAAGEHEQAKNMVSEMMSERPHSLAVAKALWTMEEAGEGSVWNCSEFSKVIFFPNKTNTPYETLDLHCFGSSCLWFDTWLQSSV